MCTKRFEHCIDFSTADCWKGRSKEEDVIARELNKNLCRMLTVYDFCDHVFCLEVESFYWDLECCVEWEPHLLVREYGYNDEYGVSV